MHDLPKLFLQTIFESDLPNLSKRDLIQLFVNNTPIDAKFTVPYEESIKALTKITSIDEITGIFVTIYKNNKLRGCIGTFEIINNLINTILDRSYESSFNDDRFDPIIRIELPELSYKINFLKKSFMIEPTIESLINNFITGLHGIRIYFNSNRSATYIASVMTEHYELHLINIKSDEYYNKIKKIIEDLQIKANSDSDIISKIELYECIEL